MSAAWYKFVRFVTTNLVFRPLGGIRSVGSENVPLEGGVIFAPIHLSHLDPPGVACATKRHMRFMAKEELFKVPGLGWLIKSLGAFSVKRGSEDTEAIRTAMSALEAGEAVLIFPEGTRGDGNTLLPLNKGVAMLAKRTNAKVIPVAIVGTHRSYPRGKMFPKYVGKMIFAFGQPFTYSEIATDSSEKVNRVKFTEELGQRLVKLCNENGLDIKIEPGTESQIEPVAPV